MASFEFLEDDQTDSNGQARFTVFGVGGAGGTPYNTCLSQIFKV